MAIQIPNPGTGNGATGDNEFVLWSKVKDNFNDQSNAASRLLGTEAGNVMEVGAFGIGSASKLTMGNVSYIASSEDLLKTQMVNNNNDGNIGYGKGLSWGVSERNFSILGTPYSNKLLVTVLSDVQSAPNSPERVAAFSYGEILVLGFNVTKDANGFLKGASPVIDMYNSKIDLNQDAKQQGGITFEKLGVGDYLVKGSLGFSQEGWYIETPKDANGNVLVAVVYEQLANNDLSIKTYDYMLNKKGRIVPDTETPLDIPEGRFISLRLHELPKEMPVKSDDIQPEEVGLDK